MDEEEKRLDLMMEVDRQNAIKIQEEIEKKRKEERLIGVYITALYFCLPQRHEISKAYRTLNIK